jgi:hypothetical protein
MNMIKCAKVGHLDVLMKLFVLSLEDDALHWFISFLDNSISTKDQLEDTFVERWEEKKDSRHLLASLSGAKKNENETVEEFNE